MGLLFITVQALKNIKNGSHGTIHVFKNYFATVLSVFSFQFSVSATINSIQTDPEGQCNFSIPIPSHGFEKNEMLVDGRYSGPPALVGDGRLEIMIGGNVLVFILFILGNKK